jgi:type VI protein secretion system component VasF
MGLFTPVKKHANKFRYIPRYYDPEKERREQRRKELHGTSSEQEGQEYQPGQYIRTQREARRVAQSVNEGRRKMPSMFVLMLLAAAVVVLYMMYPRIVDAFTATRTSPEEQMKQEIEEFNPYAPITIVPNDYKEE